MARKKASKKKASKKVSKPTAPSREPLVVFGGYEWDELPEQLKRDVVVYLAEHLIRGGY